MTQTSFLDETPAEPRKGISAGGWVLIIGIVLFSVVLGVQMTRQNRVQPQAGEVAPNFSMTTFDGETLTLESLRGQVVLLNFWGSWCPPCRDEAPDLQELYQDYAERGFVIIGINWLDTERGARAFLNEFGITYPNAPDVGERIGKLYRIQGAPESFLIDQEGKVVSFISGQVRYATLARELERLLRAGS